MKATTHLNLAVMTAMLTLAPLAHADNDKDVMMNQLPDAVQTTIRSESQDGRVGEIEKKVENNQTYYEAKIYKGAEAHEIDIAEDGTVLKREND